MTDEEFKALDSGDIVRHKNGADAFVVTANYGSYVIAVRTQNLGNPREWDLVGKCSMISNNCVPQPVVLHDIVEHEEFAGLWKVTRISEGGAIITAHNVEARLDGKARGTSRIVALRDLRHPDPKVL